MLLASRLKITGSKFASRICLPAAIDRGTSLFFILLKLHYSIKIIYSSKLSELVVENADCGFLYIL